MFLKKFVGSTVLHQIHRINIERSVQLSAALRSKTDDFVKNKFLKYLKSLRQEPVLVTRLRQLDKDFTSYQQECAIQSKVKADMESKKGELMKEDDIIENWLSAKHEEKSNKN